MHSVPFCSSVFLTAALRPSPSVGVGGGPVLLLCCGHSPGSHHTPLYSLPPPFPKGNPTQQRVHHRKQFKVEYETSHFWHWAGLPCHCLYNPPTTWPPLPHTQWSSVASSTSHLLRLQGTTLTYLSLCSWLSFQPPPKEPPFKNQNSQQHMVPSLLSF